MAGLVNRRVLRIEWGQCDPAGIVFYPQYLILLDSCTGLLFERTGLSASGIRRKYGIVGMPLVEQGARFLLPCRFDDEITIDSSVEQWGRTSFMVRHLIRKGGEIAVDAFEKRVWAAPDPDRPAKIKAERVPPEVIAALSDPAVKPI
jgi:4-hydroxybenzoyl-CoA thioesterase